MTYQEQAGRAADGTPRTADTVGRNTLYSLKAYDSFFDGRAYDTLDICEKIARKCRYGIEGRMAKVIDPRTNRPKFPTRK